MRDRRLSWGAAVVLVTMGVGVALLARAMQLYPGGNFFDRHAAHHSFWLNFLCDLTGAQSAGGASNPGSPSARAAIASLAIALGAFWLILPSLLPASSRGARAASAVIRVAGALSAVGLLAVPIADGAAHAVAVYAAAGPGLVASVTAFVALVRGSRDVALLLPASSAIVAGAIDSVLYARRVLDHFVSCPPALPALQRVAGLLMLAWMAATAWRVLRRPRDEAGP
jgi:hypothetical protein